MRLLMKLSLVLGVIVLSAGLALAYPGEVLQKTDSGSGFNKGVFDCTGAVPITCGSVVNGTNLGAPSVVEYYSCLGWSFSGGEVAYELTLDADYDVTVYLLPDDSSNDLALFVLDGCDEDQCLAGSDGYGDEEIVISLAANTTYYVVVDGYGTDDEGDFTLSITCEAGPMDPIELQGAEDCNDGICLLPFVERIITGTTVGYANDYDPITGASGTSCTGFQCQGPDVVYEVGLSDGATLVVDLERDGYWDHCLYLLTDCQDMDSCVAGSDVGTVDHIEWTNTTGATMLYYLVVDGFNPTSEGSYTLTYTHDGVDCDDPIATEEQSWGGLKRMFR